MATYKGTVLTGTSTSAKEFRKLNIPGKKVWFYVDDLYYNTKTGHVYRCTSAGYDKPTKKYPNYSKWAYDHTEVIAKPNDKVTDMCAPARGTNNLTFTSKWKVQSDLTDSKNGKRCSKLQIMRGFNVSAGKSTDTAYSVAAVDTSTTSAAVNVNSFNPGFPCANLAAPYSRSSFYPHTKWKMDSLFVSVEAKNSKGLGPAAVETVKFAKPPLPTVAVAVNTTSWKVTFTITPAPDKGRAERELTQYELQTRTSANQDWQKVDAKSGTNSGSSAFTVEYDVVNAQTPGTWTEVRLHARSQGLAGDSKWTDWVSHTVGWPSTPTTGKLTIETPDVATSYGSVSVKTNSTETHPVDQVVLQLLVPGENDTDVTTATAAAASGDWEDTNATDDAQCKSLSFLVSDATPYKGKHAWLRVKAWHDKDGTGGFTTFSEPVELKKLHQDADPDPTAADDTAVISSAKNGTDGQSAVVTLLWARSGGTDDSDETEVTWSADADAWASTEEPQSYTVADSRAESGSYSYGGSTYTKRFILTIRGLETGVLAYVRARRHMSANDTYGPYSNTAKVTPNIAPEAVVLSAPAYSPYGKPITLAWAWTGGGNQSGWFALNYQPSAHDYATCGIGGRGPSSYTIPWELIKNHIRGNTVAYRVRVSVGGEYVTSNTATVRIAQQPTLAFGALSTLTAQPLQIPLVSNIATASVAVVVTANGISGASPDGGFAQPAGDTVFSGTFAPAWTLSNGSYTATVELPPALEFHENGTYTVEAVSTDTVTGLQSDAVQTEIDMLWSHQAPAPSDSIELTPAVTVDADGNTARSVAIALAAPVGYASGDVYDVYRLTGDGAQLVAEGLALDDTVTDRFAPFGDLACHYRIALRTADGDAEWLDYEYQLDGPVIRFDFDGEEHSYVELHWNIGATEQWAKDFAASRRMDGSKGGAWSAYVEHGASYQSDIIRLTEQNVIDAVRDLARCNKPVFVRTGYGTAFAANVDVDSMDLAALGGRGVAVSFKCTEVDLTDGFRIPAEAPATTTTTIGA